MLAEYQQKLRDAGTEAGKVMEEARKTAEQMRKDLLAKAEDESRQIVAKAQEEVRAERDRAVQALRRELAEASVELAARVVGESLDKERQMRLVEQYIDEVAGMSSNGNGKGS
jgi:F-type H+-transporting ATPase subunit b